MDFAGDIKERLPEDGGRDMAIGGLLAGAGLITTLLGMRSEREGATSWMLPAVLLASGVALLAEGGMSWRGGRIQRAEEAVRDGLRGLDPLARAQVLMDVAEEEASQATELIGRTKD